MVRHEYVSGTFLECGGKSEKLLLELAGKYTPVCVDAALGYPLRHSDSSDKESIVSERIHVEKVTRRKFCGVLSLLLAFCICASGCYIMWNTNLFSMVVQQNLVLKNTSMRFVSWQKVPVHAYLHVYLFNYTNIEEFENGDATKLKVQEIGPYSYIEHLERVNVVNNDNGTVTYQNKKIYHFSEEFSKGSETDSIVVPNIPYMGTIALAKDYNGLTRFSLSGLLNTMKSRPFIRLPAGEFIWGYDEELSRLASKVLALQYDVPFAKFGILASKNGTQNDVITIHTGEKDLSKIGVVSRYNGDSSLSFWNSQECNRIDGTDGTIYPPALLNKNSPISVYTKDMCRKISLYYSGEYYNKHELPVMRYDIPKNIFESGETEAKNQCYCTQSFDSSTDSSNCLPSGTFNASPCAFGSPIVTSLPHFLYGDSVLLQDFEGLHPQEDKHRSFVEVDPIFGSPIGGKSRFQINIMLHQTTWISSLSPNYRDKIILPVAWIDFGIERIPDEVKLQIKTLLLLVYTLDLILSYGFILLTAVIFCLIVRKTIPKVEKGSYTKNVQLSSTTQIPLVIQSEKV